MLVVDPWDWLDEGGSFLFGNPLIYRRNVRIRCLQTFRVDVAA